VVNPDSDISKAILSRDETRTTSGRKSRNIEKNNTLPSSDALFCDCCTSDCLLGLDSGCDSRVIGETWGQKAEALGCIGDAVEQNVRHDCAAYTQRARDASLCKHLSSVYYSFYTASSIAACYRKGVRVCLSVCLSVTPCCLSKWRKPRITKFLQSPPPPWKILVSESVKLFQKFERGHTHRGR